MFPFSLMFFPIAVSSFLRRNRDVDTFIEKLKLVISFFESISGNNAGDDGDDDQKFVPFV
jgi:hypothetical protein